MTPLLQLESLSKSFGGVAALTDVSLSVRRGTLHALVGENGAGKSTLIKCLAGIHAPDSGRILWEGQPVLIPNAARANALGMEVVFQEITLAPNLTVAESLFLCREPRTRLGLVDYTRMRADARRLLTELQVPLLPDTPVERLRTAEKQAVQIARALALGGTRLLILDEPTSALSDHEIERLMELLERLRAGGTTLLYVSHKLEEILRLADEVTVLRDGRLVETRPRKGLTAGELVRLMVGREHSSGVAPPDATPFVGAGAALLSVRGLTRRPAYKDISFDVRAGEVLGVFGIVGAGRTEVARTLFGLDRPDSGEILLRGVRVRLRSSEAAVRHGIALVPEDRKLQGLLLEDSLRRNIALPNLRALTKGGLVNGAGEWEMAGQGVRRFGIAARAGIEAAVGALSGGNQQKVVLAKWLAADPRVLILDEPTKGIDVGAKTEIYRIVRELAGRGLGILLISSELDEILAVADRALVLRAGRLAATLPGAQMTRETILRYAVSAEVPSIG